MFGKTYGPKQGMILTGNKVNVLQF